MHITTKNRVAFTDKADILDKVQMRLIEPENEAPFLRFFVYYKNGQRTWMDVQEFTSSYDCDDIICDVQTTKEILDDNENKTEENSND